MSYRTGTTRSLAAWMRHVRPARAMALILIPLAMSTAGCSSSGGKQAQGDPTYIQDYQAKRYEEAYEGARSAAPNLRGTTKDHALLIQGESAHALNRNPEAKLLLRPLADGQDPRIAGQAAATLGLIYQEEGDFDDGATYLSLASDKLEGDAAARSALYAGDCLKSLGRTDEARSMYEKAQASVRTDNSLRGMITDRLSGGTPPSGVGSFTLQVGAYSTQQRAQAQADRLRQTSSNLGLGSPRVVEKTAKGKSLYSVRVGQFTSKEAAQKAARSMGVEAMVTTNN